VDDLFNSESIGKSFFYIFENISLVSEYLAYSIYFVNYEIKILIYFNFKFIIINFNMMVPEKNNFMNIYYFVFICINLVKKTALLLRFIIKNRNIVFMF